MTKLQLKWLGVLAIIAFSVYLLYPTVNWYQLDSKERAMLEANRLRPKKLLNLGLDLKGGTHLLMELDVSKLPPSSDITDAVQRAIEIIRNRVDQFGVAEPLIARQGDRWIVVQLPGITNSEQAKELVGKTALLEFRMVDSSDAAEKAVEKIAALGQPLIPKDLKNPAGEMIVSTAAAALAPAGDVLMPHRDGGFRLVSATAPLTGADLQSARVETGGSYGGPVVAFKFTPGSPGALALDALTGANVHKSMAIILDGRIISDPVINSRLTGGSGIIEGNFTIEDASKLALVLRSGALPAPVHVIEERTIGPTVGEDSIRAGLTATGIACAFIFIFMAIYYSLAGIVADIALIMNVLFLLALMAYFGFTLSLPGIAGIVLTLAISVDDNVLIFERLREEIALGKPARIALESGYDKAWTAIRDSLVATAISSVFLFQFGSGPIKGFAVTLLLGMLVGRFTAINVTLLIFQSFLESGDINTISIG